MFRSLIALGLLCMVGALIAYDVSVAVAPIDLSYVAMPALSLAMIILGVAILSAVLAAHVTMTRRPLLADPRSYSQTRRQRYDWGEARAV